LIGDRRFLKKELDMGNGEEKKNCLRAEPVDQERKLI
jgi:hypothetical protein